MGDNSETEDASYANGYIFGLLVPSIGGSLLLCLGFALEYTTRRKTLQDSAGDEDHPFLDPQINLEPLQPKIQSANEEGTSEISPNVDSQNPDASVKDNRPHLAVQHSCRKHRRWWQDAEDITLSADARKHIQNLWSKYSYYFWYALIIAIFYALPAFQLVFTFQRLHSEAENATTCYYNFKCARQLGVFHSFNNFFSNIGYVILGILYITYVAVHTTFRNTMKKRLCANINLLDEEWIQATKEANLEKILQRLQTDTQKDDLILMRGCMTSIPYSAMSGSEEIYKKMMEVASPEAKLILRRILYSGTPQFNGLFYAMGSGLIAEGVMSATYHMCPSRTNYQFDTSFMYILSSLALISLYQCRSPVAAASSFATFLFLGGIVFYVLIVVVFERHRTGETDANDPMEIIACVIFTFALIYLAIKFYYADQINLLAALRKLRGAPNNSCRPRRPLLFLFIVVGGSANMGLIIYWSIEAFTDFASFILYLFILNLILYMIFYLILKAVHKELSKRTVTPILYLLLAMALWLPALRLFTDHVTDWNMEFDESREKNRECLILNFYDVHDIWHFLSAFALFSSFLMLYHVDDDLIDVRRDKIHIF